MDEGKKVEWDRSEKGKKKKKVEGKMLEDWKEGLGIEFLEGKRKKEEIRGMKEKNRSKKKIEVEKKFVEDLFREVGRERNNRSSKREVKKIEKKEKRMIKKIVMKRRKKMMIMRMKLVECISKV